MATPQGIIALILLIILVIIVLVVLAYNPSPAFVEKVNSNCAADVLQKKYTYRKNSPVISNFTPQIRSTLSPTSQIDNPNNSDPWANVKAIRENRAKEEKRIALLDEQRYVN